MAPSRVSDDPPAMASDSRKRSAEPNDDQPSAKRMREMPSSVILAIGSSEESPCSIDLATSEELARKAMRRSLSLVLQKVGFDSATPDAMESFVSMTEICKTRWDCPALF
jgi:transcription initiation factor TFIID subunit 8